MPTAAKTDGGPAGQAKSLTLGIEDFELTFYPDRSVIVHRDLGGRHFSPLSLFKYAHTCSERQGRTTREQQVQQSNPEKDSKKLQYLGTDGSTSSDHARMPPLRLRILRKPALRRKSTASAERLPLRQCATISRDESSS